MGISFTLILTFSNYPPRRPSPGHHFCNREKRDGFFQQLPPDQEQKI